ncbi:putative sporulation protein YtxC [Paenibacillus hexagrammi]|uniref:Sporulation protein YtxC n=1 Tax=Paenibacillus hexagrammi TaxID=2908839 RepID=A0ABY3SMU3_9BACL|nr:putative sporulation protein YtxC [Paenibacillus sp. YPD9-1]UJF34539.1 putative sporulation protein YtxC [Paenibacillus sp. YPD9-1]
MDVFAIVVMSKDESYVSELSSQIESELGLLHKLQVHYKQYEQYAHIWGSLMENYVEGFNGAELKSGLSQALARHIMKEKEPQLLRDLISKEFKFEAKEDVDSIIGYCDQMLNGDADLAESSYSSQASSAARRSTLLTQLLIQYLDESDECNLDGFLNFRLQEYVGELREIVEYAVDEFMMDRQYQEFISLLQYFVYIQEAKIPAAHLIHKGGHEFTILNDRLEPIDTSDIDATFKLEVLEKDLNFEDMIVSTLISVSPANIYIHTREPELSIIKTISQIFEDRTTLCSYCRLCESFLGEKQKQDQLYP